MYPRDRIWQASAASVRGGHRRRTLPMSGLETVLDLDFMSGSLPGACTFARTGTGSYINSLGLLVSVGTDVPRFAYDAAGSRMGLLMEGTQINYLCHSQTFSISGGTNQWVDSADFLRYTADNTAPDGTATALQASCDVANATCINSLSRVPDVDSVGGTFSIWLRRVSGSGSIQLTDNNGTNWTTVAVTSSWQRFSLPYRTTAQQCGVRIVTGGDAIQMWGAQLEDGSGASSYIPTTILQGTRNCETLVCTDPAIASIDPTACTVVIDMSVMNEHGGRVSGTGSETNNFTGIVTFNNGSTDSPRLDFLYNNGSLANPRVLLGCYNASSALITGFCGFNRTALARSCFGASVSGSGVAPTRLFSVLGVSATGSSTGTNGPVGSMSRLHLNSSKSSSGLDDYPSWAIRRIRVWNEAKSQAALNLETV